MQRAKTAAFFLAAVALSSGIALAAPSPTPQPLPTATLTRSEDDVRSIELLRAAINAPRLISYVGQVQTIRWGPSGTVATISRVEHRAPDKTHRVYVAPEPIFGDAVVVRGSSTYSFSMHKQRLAVSKGPSLDVDSAANDNFGLLLANYRPISGATESVAGRIATPISLLNRFTGERLMRIWLDNQTHFILQKETYNAGGAIASRVAYDRIRYTNDIPDDVFSTDLPKGFARVAGHDAGSPRLDLERTVKLAGFTPAVPHSLPEGFTMLGSDVTTVKNVKTLHFLYSDGVRSLSLFENASNAAADFGSLVPTATKVESHDAQYVTDGPTTLLSWKEAGLSLALVGDLEIKELIAIGASVIP